MHLHQPTRNKPRIVTKRKAIATICSVAIFLSAAVLSSYAQSPKRFIAGWVRFTNVGDPAKQAIVELRRRGSRRTIKITKTDSNGNYRFDNVASGMYRLKLRYRPGMCSETLDVDVRQKSESDAYIITDGC